MIRSTVGRLVARGVQHFIRNVNPRVIYGGDGKSPYLSRYYLLGAPTMPDGTSPFDRFGNFRPGSLPAKGSMGLYVHRFHRGDVDRELHNHPWEWALSFVIAGGYREERRVGNDVVSRVVAPLSFNFIGAEGFHRVDLLEDDAWSLFLAGPRASSWGFWDRATGKMTHWRAFLAEKQGEVE